MNAPSDETAGALRPAPLPWTSVVMLALVMSCGDAFWITSLEGAVGPVSRTQEPFHSWMIGSAALLPVFVVAVAAALARARRRWGTPLRRPRVVVGATVLAALAGTGVGIAALVANAAYDFHVQSEQLELVHRVHSADEQSTASSSHQAKPSLHEAGCDALCSARDATLEAHVRGVERATSAVLVTNILGAGWVVALRGGDLDPSWTRRPRRSSRHRS